jgi:hypothetical protein
MDIVEVGALVLGLTQVLKGFIPENLRNTLTPVVAVLLGAFANCYVVGNYEPATVTTGLMYGLTVAGLYKVPNKTI